MRNYWTKKDCDFIIERNKNNTAFFGNNSGIAVDDNPDYIDGKITFDAMCNLLAHRMGFGEAETNVIIACLIKCGAKIV